MNKIIAIVVTYNRLDCLKECLVSLRQQTYKDFDILVVNNGSTDGTREFLDMQTDILVIHQDNLGGAGGFYAGTKYMFDYGYDWAWLMDDDGLPDSKQLEELMKFSSESCYLNALVIDKDNNDSFAFTPLDVNFTIDVAKNKVLLPGFVHPFNGTLFSRSMIEKIGFVKKEMFIWGDEKEYTARAEKAGYVPTTVTSAIHYHPKEKAVKKYLIPFWKNPFWEVLLKPEKLSHNYYRNLGYLDSVYRTIPKSIKLVSVHFFYFLRSFKFKEMVKFFKYYFKGRRNDFN